MILAKNNFRILKKEVKNKKSLPRWGQSYSIKGIYFGQKPPPGGRNKFNLEKHREEIHLEKNNDKLSTFL